MISIKILVKLISFKIHLNHLNCKASFDLPIREHVDDDDDDDDDFPDEKTIMPS